MRCGSEQEHNCTKRILPPMNSYLEEQCKRLELLFTLLHLKGLNFIKKTPGMAVKGSDVEEREPVVVFCELIGISYHEKNIHLSENVMV